MSERTRCYNCKNKTDEPVKVAFVGYREELPIPAQINLCPRCNDQWEEDIKMLR